MNRLWTDLAWEQYLYWQEQDKKTLRKINKLIEDISRNGNQGLGRPEPLKGNLTGLWSREIDKKNRLIYVIEDDTLTIIQCKNHYKDK
ncbi:Txe/YoeB family addiction module toxin [Treponema pedis]|uniref:Putative mRNA interferase YoeB n=1 Tax=Treponema pedis str. T A4 TaxID=1291379 RepID=S5ZL89_9SPIR|nr:Txe/YoeB family addiction module toxin [Treponema pedis]AGT43342.1 Txe/YoeB family addiction module toxin [Treponema pedis str. T A4]